MESYLTDCSHLKIDGWKMILSFWDGPGPLTGAFAMLVSGRVGRFS